MRGVMSVILATVWISVSEFVRNEVFVKSFWEEHYQSLGLKFPSDPLNGAVWGIWSLMFSVSIFVLSKKFTHFQTTLISWFMAFAMMWVVTANLGVLPFGLLWYAIPLSLIEAYLAGFIIFKFQDHKELK
jgi:hypothetical protein